MREGPGARLASSHGGPQPGEPAHALIPVRTPTAWAGVFELLDRCSVALQQARRIAQRDRDAARVLVALERVDDSISEVRDAALAIDEGERWDVFGPLSRFVYLGAAYEVTLRGADGVCGLRPYTGDERPLPHVVKVGACTDKGVRVLVGGVPRG